MTKIMSLTKKSANRKKQEIQNVKTKDLETFTLPTNNEQNLLTNTTQKQHCLGETFTVFPLQAKLKDTTVNDTNKQKTNSHFLASKTDDSYSGTPLHVPTILSDQIQRGFGINTNELILRESPDVSSMGARATAQGNTIRFAPGEYKPTTQEGLTLIGHELEHVKEQATGDIHAPAGNIFHDTGCETRCDNTGKAFATETLHQATPINMNKLSTYNAPIQCSPIEPPEQVSRPTLRRYANNDKDAVIECQQLLRDKGYYLGKTGEKEDGVDGYFGEKTQNAVIDFQTAYQVETNDETFNVDGIVGPKTWAALYVTNANEDLLKPERIKPEYIECGDVILTDEKFYYIVTEVLGKVKIFPQVTGKVKIFPQVTDRYAFVAFRCYNDKSVEYMKDRAFFEFIDQNKVIAHFKKGSIDILTNMLKNHENFPTKIPPEGLSSSLNPKRDKIVQTALSFVGKVRDDIVYQKGNIYNPFKNHWEKDKDFRYGWDTLQTMFTSVLGTQFSTTPQEDKPKEEGPSLDVSPKVKKNDFCTKVKYQRLDEEEEKKTGKDPGGIQWCGIFATYVLKKAGLTNAEWVVGKNKVEGWKLRTVDDATEKEQPKFSLKNYSNDRKTYEEGITPGDVIETSAEGLNHHSIVTKCGIDDLETVNGNSDYQGIWVKPQKKKDVWRYYSINE